MGPNETELRKRLAKARNFHVDWGPKAADMTLEERCGVILKAMDERGEVADRPPRSGRPKINVRDFVAGLK
jgi:hypothetical protein